MINQEIEMFLRFDLTQTFREKFYPELFKYFDFIIPLLKKGKHTRKNEMNYVGSQYLYLSYVAESKSTIFVILRNEQGRDIIFRVNKDSVTKSVEVYVAHSENSFEERLKRDSRVTAKKKGISLEFSDVEDVKRFIRSYQEDASITNKTADVVRKPKIDPADAKLSVSELISKMLTETKKDKTPRPQALFSVSENNKKQVLVMTSDSHTFQQELEIFQLMNTMLCGVCDICEVPFPKQFFNKEVEAFVTRLQASLK